MPPLQLQAENPIFEKYYLGTWVRNGTKINAQLHDHPQSAQSAQMHNCTNAQMHTMLHKCTNAQMHNMHKCTIPQMLDYSNAQNAQPATHVFKTAQMLNFNTPNTDLRPFMFRCRAMFHATCFWIVLFSFDATCCNFSLRATLMRCAQMLQCTKMHKNAQKCSKCSRCSKCKKNVQMHKHAWCCQVSW